MTRNIINKIKLYVEGKREYLFFAFIIKLTNNQKKYSLQNLNGGGHDSMYQNITSDSFDGGKKWIADNKDNKKDSENIYLKENTKLINDSKNNNIDTIISCQDFDDEIIDFLDINKIKDTDNKKSIDNFLKNNHRDVDKKSLTEYLENKFKNKKDIKNNLDKIKNGDLKNLLNDIINSWKEDEYR